MLLRIASLRLKIKFQFRSFVNVSLFSNSFNFFPGDGSSLRSLAIPLYIIHITFGMLRVMKMKEVKKKSNNVLIIYFGSVPQKHQQAAYFSGVLANLIRHCIIEKKNNMPVSMQNE